MTNTGHAPASANYATNPCVLAGALGDFLAFQFTSVGKAPQALSGLPLTSVASDARQQFDRAQ